MSERRPATTIGELDIHLSHIQGDMVRIAAAVNNMATREDIATLTNRLEKMATKEEVRALEERLSKDSVPSTFDRWAEGIKKAALLALFSMLSTALSSTSANEARL